MTTNTQTTWEVEVREHHWNGTDIDRSFGTWQSACAFARKMQTAICNREATASIIVTAPGYRRDYSVM